MPIRPAALLAPIVLLTALGLALSPSVARGQSAPAREGGAYLTVFRSPATGVELRSARAGIHAGFYPTILKADGQAKGENTNFVRLGASVYARSQGWSPYFAPALLVSLDDDWKSGVLSDAGVRVPLARRTAFRLGVGVLTTFDGEIRVNPTVGLDIRLGGNR